MPEPVLLATLGVAMGKLLLRWADLNDTADALGDARAGFSALRSLRPGRVRDPVSDAITGLLEQRLAAVRDTDRREQMRIAVADVADLFTDLSDADIVAAAQHPGGFTDYLARGPGRSLMTHTEEAVSPFTWQVMNAGAEVFAQLAPRSGRFAAGALVRLLDQVDVAVTGVAGLPEQIGAARAALIAAVDRVTERVEALHPKVDAILQVTPQGPVDAISASQRATQDRRIVGLPFTDWDPEDLGVHASITVDNETDLAPYLMRAHDHHLRALLAVLNEPGARSRVVLVVGTSCTGKTRTLYEAVRQTLPHWQLVVPRTDKDLAQLLRGGVPKRTILWLDELQDRLTATADGIAAARGLHELVETTEAGPILVAATIWPINRAAMQARPDPTAAASGAAAIAGLIAAATSIDVPESFTDNDLTKQANQAAAGDPRLLKAIATAAHTIQPDDGRRVTQVLAGGTQLVQRLHPRPGTHAPAGEFTPAARAVLHAAADLRRIGMPNPLPRWAIEGAAPSYLHPLIRRPADTWLYAGLAEATEAARHDDPLIGTRTLDIHNHGVPALTPHWTINPDGTLLEAYDLHDYLYQDHLTRHRHTATQVALWSTLTRRVHAWDTARELAGSAVHRGLLAAAIDLTRPHAYDGHSDAARLLAKLLAKRGDLDSLEELRARVTADTGDLDASSALASLLAERGDPDSLTELRARAANGDLIARLYLPVRSDRGSLNELRRRADTGDILASSELAEYLAECGDPDSLDELRARTDIDDMFAGEKLASLLAQRGDPDSLDELRALANADRVDAIVQLINLLAERGDPDSLDELRALASTGIYLPKIRLAERDDPGALDELRALALEANDNYIASNALAIVLAKRGDPDSIDELRVLATTDHLYAGQHLVDLLAERGDPSSLDELRALADNGDPTARKRLDRLLANRGDPDSLKELRARTDAGDIDAREQLADLLAERGDPDSLDELRLHVLAGFGGLQLLAAYRRRFVGRSITELDCDATPIYE